MKLAVGFFAAAILSAVDASAGPPTLPRDGDYLSTAYLAALEKTKSHRNAAEKAGSPQEITVSRDKRGLVLDLCINWHEGNSAVIDPNKTLVGSSFDPIDATHFHFEDEKRRTYQYVGNALGFIAEKLLVGTYVDRRGRTYVFGRDGKVRFPGRTFRYELYEDTVFDDDSFTDLDATTPNHLRNYGFKWKGNTLFLYNADCESETSPGCVMDRKHPLAILRQTGG